MRPRRKETITMLGHTAYNPGALLDLVQDSLGVTSDTALCQLLCLAPSTLCRVRQKKVPLTPMVLLAFYDATGMSIEQLREAGGIP